MKRKQVAAAIIVCATTALSASCKSSLWNVPQFMNRNQALEPSPPSASPSPSPSASPSPSIAPSASPSPSIAPSPVTLAITGNVAGDQTDTWLFNGGEGRPLGARQKATADIVDQIEPDAVLLTGNGQYYDGTYENYLAAYESTWGRFKGITHPTVGVHDYDNDGYFRYFGAAAGDPDKAYYSFDLGAWHIVALNSICSKVGVGVGSEQERWLRQDLEANKGKPILAYWFNTRFSSGPYGSDSSLKPFWQALFDYHAQLVINGSDHLYERFAPQDPEGKADPQGIRQFTSGLGGSTFYQLERNCPNSEKSYNQSFGVLKLTLSSDSYEWEFLPEPGNDFTDKGRQVIR